MQVSFYSIYSAENQQLTRGINMAESDFRSRGYQSGFGALLSGLRTGSDTLAKNRFERNQKIDDRRFEMAKMMAQNLFSRETEMMKYNREQNPGQPMYGMPGQLTVKQLLEQNEKNRKLEEGEEPSADELVAFETGKLPGEKYEGLEEEQMAAVIAELAKQKGFSKSGSREEVESPGFLGMGKKTKKLPIYSKNQFQR